MVKMTYIFLQTVNFVNLQVALWLRRRWELYFGPCPNLLRGDESWFTAPLIVNRYAFGHELAYHFVGARRTLTDVTIYFWYRGWLMVPSLFKEDYVQIFKCVSDWFQSFCGKWEGLPQERGKPLKCTSWMAEGTPTDRPRSARNRWVFEVVCGVCVLSLCFFILIWNRGVVIGLSQICSFFSYLNRVIVISYTKATKLKIS